MKSMNNSKNKLNSNKNKLNRKKSFIFQPMSNTTYKGQLFFIEIDI